MAELNELTINGSNYTFEDDVARQLITQTNANFANYYTKAESYSASEVDTLLRTQRQGQFVVANTLPSPSADTMFKIYLVPSGNPETQNVKDEFVTLENNGTYSWEQIGTTAVDLSGYSTTEEMNAAIANALASYYTKSEVDNAIKNMVAESGVYDVSANNDNTKFESLSALLGSANLNTLIPTDIRKGGMSIKFVQSSDNKYVQYRLMSDTFNTTPANWQGVDKEPTAGSNNLSKSGGVYKANVELIKDLSLDITLSVKRKSPRMLGTGKFGTDGDHFYMPVSAGEKYVLQNGESVNFFYAFATTDSSTSGGDIPLVSGTSLMKVERYSKVLVTIPDNCPYLLVNYFSFAVIYKYLEKPDKAAKFIDDYCIESYEGEHTIASNETEFSIIPNIYIKGGATYLFKIWADRDLYANGCRKLRLGVTLNSATDLYEYVCETPLWVCRKTLVGVSRYTGRIFLSIEANQIVGAKIYIKAYVLNKGTLPIIGETPGISTPYTIGESDAKLGDFESNPFDFTKRILSCYCSPSYLRAKAFGKLVHIAYPFVARSTNPIGGKIKIFEYQKDDVLVSYPEQDFESPIRTMAPLGYETPNTVGWKRGFWKSKNTNGNAQNQTAYPYILDVIKGHRYVIYAKSASLITPVDAQNPVTIKIGIGANDAFIDEEGVRLISPESLYNGVYLEKTAHTTVHSGRLWISMSNGTEDIDVDIYVQDRTEDIVCLDIKYNMPCSKAPNIELPYRGNRIESKYIALGIPYKVSATVNNVQYNNLLSQGFAIWNNYAFKLFQNGYCIVYDISNYKKYVEVAKFPLGSFNTSNHANRAQFGNVVAEGSDFPLLYVETNGPAGVYATTYVEKITIANGIWSSETVQTIYVDGNTIEELNSRSIRQDELDLFDTSHTIILYAGCIGDDGYLYSIGYDKEKEVFHIVKWELPDISETEYRLKGEDAITHCIRQDYDRNVYVNQGGCYYNKQYFQVYGGIDTDSNIEVYDFNRTYTWGEDVNIKTIIDIDSLYGEPEDVDAHCANLITTFNYANWMIEIKK